MTSNREPSWADRFWAWIVKTEDGPAGLQANGQPLSREAIEARAREIIEARGRMMQRADRELGDFLFEATGVPALGRVVTRDLGDAARLIRGEPIKESDASTMDRVLDLVSAAPLVGLGAGAAVAAARAVPSPRHFRAARRRYFEQANNPAIEADQIAREAWRRAGITPDGLMKPSVLHDYAMFERTYDAPIRVPPQGMNMRQLEELAATMLGDYKLTLRAPSRVNIRTASPDPLLHRIVPPGKSPYTIDMPPYPSMVPTDVIQVTMNPLQILKGRAWPSRVLAHELGHVMDAQAAAARMLHGGARPVAALESFILANTGIPAPPSVVAEALTAFPYMARKAPWYRTQPQETLADLVSIALTRPHKLSKESRDYIDFVLGSPVLPMPTSTQRRLLFPWQ